MQPPSPQSFHWTECERFLSPGAEPCAWTLEREARGFRAGELRMRLPLVAPLPAGCASLAEYVEGLPQELGRHCVILMQAGAVSLGLLEAGQPLHTKTLKKYVVRGSGRAQPAHLKTKGKSRYGSRLRLQNAQQLFDESAERLEHWWREEGPIERIFVSAPERMWADFMRLGVPEALRDRDAWTRIPLDLPRPTTELLLRTYRALEYGRILPRSTILRDDPAT